MGILNVYQFASAEPTINSNDECSKKDGSKNYTLTETMNISLSFQATICGWDGGYKELRHISLNLESVDDPGTVTISVFDSFYERTDEIVWGRPSPPNPINRPESLVVSIQLDCHHRADRQRYVCEGFIPAGENETVPAITYGHRKSSINSSTEYRSKFLLESKFLRTEFADSMTYID